MQLPLYIHNYINKKISYEETCAEIKEEANYTRVQLASSELVPSELLNFMGINETHIPVLLALAKNKNTPEDMLVHLAHQNYPLIREEVVKNTATPAFVCEVLSEDEDGFVRYYAKKRLEILNKFK